jgi:START-like superfamily domain
MERVKFQIKYSFRTKAKDLFLALTKPAFLQNWIASGVEFDPVSGVYTFHWNSYKESARISEQKTNEFVKWEWVGGDRRPGEFVSYSIVIIPGDDWIDLVIEDFCENGDQAQVKAGWEKQLLRLEKLVN